MPILTSTTWLKFYWNIIIIFVNFRDIADVIEQNIASSSSSSALSVSYATAFAIRKLIFNAISAGIISLLLCYSFNLTSSLNQWSAGVYEGNLVAQIVFILFKRSVLSSELTGLNSTPLWYSPLLSECG